jgi:hypothetical protein
MACTTHATRVQVDIATALTGASVASILRHTKRGYVLDAAQHLWGSVGAHVGAAPSTEGHCPAGAPTDPKQDTRICVGGLVWTTTSQQQGHDMMLTTSVLVFLTKQHMIQQTPTWGSTCFPAAFKA